VYFSVFTSLFIEYKETLKIIRFSPSFTGTKKNPKIKLSKIGLRLTWFPRTGALDRTAIDQLLARASVGPIVP
jgi:hypothetical protein